MTKVSTCTAALAPMRWALEMTCSSRLAFSSGSIRNTQDTKERSSPTDPASSISSTLHWLFSCNVHLPCQVRWHIAFEVRSRIITLQGM